jgi:PAS domain S-box-containing protein
MAEKVKCWELLKCGEEECPAFESGYSMCWLTPMTRCHGGIQGSATDKIEVCLKCELMTGQLDTSWWKETLGLLYDRFKAAQRMVAERDTELERISLELALGLSEVLEALNRISSGDTDIEIPESSELELVARLKRKVNETAVNLAEIIDFSHEIAIGLAEHFDVLDRVTKGDLTARVAGHSSLELMEALKKMANQMVESVSREIEDRKRAEAELRTAHNRLETRVQERTAELRTANELLKAEIDERRRIMEALRKSEMRYQSVVEDQTELICRFRPNGELTFVNNAYCRYFDKQREDLVGRKIISGLLDDSYEDIEELLAFVDADGHMETREHRLVGPGGELRWQQWTVRAVRNEAGEAVEFQAVGRDVTDRKRAEDRLLVYHKRLRSLASSLSLAEQQERRRIATEVHDHIGQNLAFSKIKLGTLLATLPSEAEKKDVRLVVKLVDEAIQDTRSLVSELGSPILYELGFVPAVEWLTQKMRREHGIEVDFEDDGKPKPLGDDVRVLLFQAVRELLANVIRHADARNAKVSITTCGDQIRVDVKDDGIGFDPTDISPGLDQDGRFGLFSIRERLEPLGGRLEMVSQPGQGAEVVLTGPLHPDGNIEAVKAG